jgi:hypothetical protein
MRCIHQGCLLRIPEPFSSSAFHHWFTIVRPRLPSEGENDVEW